MLGRVGQWYLDIMTLSECLKGYLTGNLFLPWKISRWKGLSAAWMETIELIRKLPASAQQDDACVVGAFIYNVDPKLRCMEVNQELVQKERCMWLGPMQKLGWDVLPIIYTYKSSCALQLKVSYDSTAAAKIGYLDLRRPEIQFEWKWQLTRSVTQQSVSCLHFHP